MLPFKAATPLTTTGMARGKEKKSRERRRARGKHEDKEDKIRLQGGSPILTGLLPNLMVGIGPFEFDSFGVQLVSLNNFVRVLSWASAIGRLSLLQGFSACFSAQNTIPRTNYYYVPKLSMAAVVVGFAYHARVGL